MEDKKKNTGNKRKDISNFLMMLAIIIMANYVFSFYFQRFDLTSEKRFTLAESTRKLLKNLDDVVYLKVYLEGDLTPGFTRLRNETKEILDEFRAYSNNQVEYEFINPAENPNKEEVFKIEKQLYDKGIVPEQMIESKKQKTSEALIWPGAIVTFKGKETALQLFRKPVEIPYEQAINNSVQELEYGLTNTIRKLQAKRKPEITFIEGHGELDTLRQYDFMRSLTEYYDVNRLEINQQIGALRGTDAIVITQPDSTFHEKDKFIIDQFIMNGGKVLWMIDPVYLDMDTFRIKGFTLGFGRDLNIEDMLFKYGVRLNPVLVQDLSCSYIGIDVGMKGQKNIKVFPWLYSPLIQSDINHPIVKNLDLIELRYASTLDTVSAKGISKTILLHTSKYTKTQPVPARVALAMVKFQPKESQFRNANQPVACLLEGEFESVYKNRLVMHDSVIKAIGGFKDHGVKSKMIVVADGDIARNEIIEGRLMDLGYNKYVNQTFANKKFLLNCINYLLDDEGLLQLRAREVKLRMLDRKKIANHETKWKMINIALPLGVLIAFGLLQFYFRKRKYSG